jgi:hypothetical protein
MKTKWKIKMIVFSIISMVAMIFAVMWLWNWLVPDIFNGPSIGFLQAAGLLLLSRIMFRGFRGFQCNGTPGPFLGKWKEHLEKMSPEQREKMRELWKKRCGYSICDDDKKDEAI